MANKSEIKLFDERQVRTVWNKEEGQCDVCCILTDWPDTEYVRSNWKILKHGILKEGNETVTNSNRLKSPSEDGTMHLTDVATTEQLFRLIQSIPSPKAEPFKQWMAQVAAI